MWFQSGRNDDLVCGDTEQDTPQQIEQNSQCGSVTWVSSNDGAATCVDGRRHEPRLQRVVNPFTNTHKQKPQTEQQSVRVGNAFDVNGEAYHGERCAKCNKQVVPALDLEPGVRFTPHASSHVETPIVDQGGAA